MAVGSAGFQGYELVASGESRFEKNRRFPRPEIEKRSASVEPE